MTTATEPAHGTKSRYVRGCRCPECTEAERLYAAERARLRAYGRWEPFTDAGPVREHVRSLMAASVSAARVATLSGLSLSTVSHVVWGHDGKPARRVRAHVAAALLAVSAGAPAPADGARVDATGTRRRLRALCAAGWSRPALAARLGADESGLYHTLAGRPLVRASTARAVRALYDEMWDQPPPEGTRSERISAAKARGHAARMGWPPPMAWDDDAIDLPGTSPADGWRRPARLRPAEVAAEARDLMTRQGLTPALAADRLGVAPRTLSTILRRHPEAA